MWTKRAVFHSLVLTLMLLLSTSQLSASSGKGNDDFYKWQPEGKYDSRGRKGYDDDYYKRHGYELDRRHHHDHYYPRPGSSLRVLPKNYRAVPYRGTKFYFHAGVWYRPSGAQFIVTVPPVGLMVPFLPPYYTTIWIGSIPYYYAAGTYYTWLPERRVYMVTDPPPETEVIEEAELPEQLYIYPTQGQNEEQQATDRYECHKWAKSQTGFDPTQPGGGVAEEQNSQKRADYNRAMKACLEARGYSVQ